MSGGIFGLTLPVDKKTIKVVPGDGSGNLSQSEYKNAGEDPTENTPTTNTPTPTKTVGIGFRLDAVPFIIGGAGAFGAYKLAVHKGQKKYAWAWALGAGVAGMAIGGVASNAMYNVTNK